MSWLRRLNDDWIVLNVEALASSNRDASLVHELYHFLSHNRSLEDLSHRWPFMRVFVEKCAYQVLEILAVTRWDRIVLVLDDLVDEAQEVVS